MLDDVCVRGFELFNVLILIYQSLARNLAYIELCFHYYFRFYHVFKGR
jgi:hypothetical protein